MTARSSWRSALLRSVSTLIAIMMVFQWRAATGAPGDVFTTAAPAIGAAAPSATGIADGDSGVSTSTGAFTYSYPIETPPGRNGLKPSLSLSYSSQAPIYGGLAAGWSLAGLPIITEDTDGGRMVEFSSKISRYQSSLAGNRSLVQVTEPGPSNAVTYRAQNDSSWMRYQRFGSGDYWWRALSPEGTTYYFGHKDGHTLGCTIVSAGYAPVTRIEDALGNQIDFYYQQIIDGECRISMIVWGQSSIASLGATAGMFFTYAEMPQTCNGDAYVGAQTSYRTGTKIVTGASRIASIASVAFAPGGQTTVHTRTVTLGYSSTTASCSAGHAPYRALTSIQESAVGVDSPQVNLPPIELTYGEASVDYGTPGSAVETPVPWMTSALGVGVKPNVYNLGWGHRPDNGWPTVEAMMLDIDGDGLIDRVQSEPTVDGNGRSVMCRARWYRNRGAAFAGATQFQLAGDINMPTLKWATPVGTPGGVYAGGPAAGSDPAIGTQERCALNYQRTAYHNSTVGFLTTCPPNAAGCVAPNNTIGVCPSTNSDCGTNGGNGKQTAAETQFAWRWMDMDGDQLPDLVGSPITGGIGSYDLQWGNAQVPLAPQEPAIFGPFPGCPSPAFTASENWSQDHYTMCNGMFPWFVYKNHGNGIFGQARSTSGTTHGTWGPLPDQILYQPIPLESASGDSSVTSRPVSQYNGNVDIDGDGFADAVRVPAVPGNRWKVYRNDGTGRLLPRTGTTPFTFDTGYPLFIARTDYTPSPSPTPVGVEGLEDLNGDGLADQWRGFAGDPAPAYVHYNDGVRFLASGTLPTADRPGTDAYPTVATSEGAPTYYVCRGRRDDARRTSDVDGDGRPDILKFPSGSTIPTAQYNLGGRFGAPVGQFGPGALHTIQVRSDNGLAPCDGAGWWETLSDLIDLDGDGVKEDVLFSSFTSYEPPDKMFVRRKTNAVAPRLLKSIKNNRGATTTVTYGSINGSAVTQSPALLKASPATTWVAQSVTTADAFAATTNTSSYKYKNPRWSAEGDNTNATNQFGFRGFEEVETTSQSGSVTIERFSYSPDWSGRLTTKIVKPSSGTNVHTIDDTAWLGKTLFGGTIRVYLKIQTDHWACKNNQAEAACRANTDTRTRDVIWYSALASTSTSDPTILLWEDTSTRFQAGPTAATGDREKATTYALYSDASSYRLRPTTSTDTVQLADGTWQLFGKSASTWDPTFGVRLTEETWVDADPDPAKHLIERWEYDPATHHVLRHWKAKQNAAGTTKTTYTYDAQQLFVATETNELGHQASYAYEYGTGTKLLTEGPNQRSCTSGCPTGAAYPVKEQDKIRVDGLGRMIERYETVSADGNVFQLYLAETNAYVDSSAVPNSSTNRLLVDETGSTWREVKTETDGHGRPIKTTVLAQGTAPVNHVTTYAYRHDGTLQSVSVPDPTLNDASLVTFTYTFDSLGRPLTVRRPDSATPSNQSGVNIAYDGLMQTTTEVVGTAGGQVAETQTVSDRFGRLSQVREKTAASTYATTTYAYGPDDLVASIVDPAGVTTSLAHDFAGRRTQITRGTRVWKYGYDKNGNMTSEQVPGSPGPTSDLDYTNFTAYDDLDRPSSKIIGKRNLSVADQNLFVSNTETFTYDVGRIGPLHYWRAFGVAPGAEMAVDMYHDGQGRQTTTMQAHGVAGFPVNTRALGEGFNITGTPRFVRPYDFIGGSNETVWTYSYDARNLPSKISMLSPQPLDLALQTRNVAGLVTKRRTNLTGPMTFAESNWTYDKLGRVTDQTVLKSGTPAQVARQTLAYFGNDDVKTLQHHLGSTSRTFTYGYDLRHQLLSTATDTASYFGATYQYTGANGAAGRLTRATQTRTITPAPAGADPRLARSVNYVYGGSDPEQVTALTNVSGGATYASYTYDAAGNQLTRSYPATNELFEYTYDGLDQLRRVVRKVSGSVTGSEEYWYDEGGDRMSIVKRNAAGAKTELVWFLGDTQAHYNASGVLTKIYSNLSLGTPVARVERTSNTATSLELQFHGLTSNTLAAVAQNGTINASFSYAPFGELLESTNAGGTTQGTAVHKRRFNDKYEDDIGALAYYGARYYDRTLIGWTQGDPLFRFLPDAAGRSPRKANLYGFTLNNALRYIDPDGRSVDAPTAGEFFVNGMNFAARTTQQGGPKVGPVVVVIVVSTVVVAGALALVNGPSIMDMVEAARQEAAQEAHRKFMAPFAAGVAAAAAMPLATPPPLEAGHTKNKRRSNQEKHQNGDARRGRDKGGEKGDQSRRPGRQRPGNRPRGPWPPKPKPSPGSNLHDDPRHEELALPGKWFDTMPDFTEPEAAPADSEPGFSDSIFKDRMRSRYD